MSSGRVRTRGSPPGRDSAARERAPHRQYVFTLPRLLRPIFGRHRPWLGELCRSAVLARRCGQINEELRLARAARAALAEAKKAAGR